LKNRKEHQNLKHKGTIVVRFVGEAVLTCGSLECAESVFGSLPQGGNFQGLGKRATKMSINDPVADIFSAIKNAAAAGHTEVVVPFSKFKAQLASLLKKEGFVTEVHKFKEKEGARFFLAIKPAYDEEGNSKISHLKRISRAGQRIYSPASKLKSPPLGIKIVSTSQGLFTEKEAKKKRLGGEVVGEVW